MPEQETLDRAEQDREEGKAPSTQAGEFVREEIHHVREGKHGARSSKQAIAIGLSKARRAGVKLPPPAEGPASTRRKAAADARKGRQGRKSRPSAKRSRATRQALKREGRRAASHRSLSRQARSSRSSRRSTASSRTAASRRGTSSRSRTSSRGAGGRRSSRRRK
jgi:uncharacterized protein DUF6496